MFDTFDMQVHCEERAILYEEMLKYYEEMEAKKNEEEKEI